MRNAQGQGHARSSRDKRKTGEGAIKGWATRRSRSLDWEELAMASDALRRCAAMFDRDGEVGLAETYHAAAVKAALLSTRMEALRKLKATSGRASRQ